MLIHSSDTILVVTAQRNEFHLLYSANGASGGGEGEGEGVCLLLLEQRRKQMQAATAVLERSKSIICVHLANRLAATLTILLFTSTTEIQQRK